MAASFFSPMPETRVKSSMDENGPFASRSATIFSAVAAPTPLSVSNSSAVAVLMLTRPSSPEGDSAVPGSLRAGGCCPIGRVRGCRLIVDTRRDDDLLAVLHLLGQVHRIGPRLVGGSSCRRHRVDDPTARLQIVDARRRHAPVHMNADAPRRSIASRREHHVLPVFGRRRPARCRCRLARRLSPPRLQHLPPMRRRAVARRRHLDAAAERRREGENGERDHERQDKGDGGEDGPGHATQMQFLRERFRAS